MADLIKQVPLVKVATIHRKDLEQISRCKGLYLDDDGVPFQKVAGEERRRELVVIGWFSDRGNRTILVQRVDDGRLLQQELLYEGAKLIAKRYPQLFVR